MTNTTALLTCDEATATIVAALDQVTATLRRRRQRPTIKALLEQRACRARLEIDEEQALDNFRATIAAVASLGHRWIISDQIDGYLSALADDPTFTSNPGRHFQEV